MPPKRVTRRQRIAEERESRSNRPQRRDRLDSRYGAIAEPAEVMIESENLNYIPAPGDWYFQRLSHRLSQNKLNPLRSPTWEDSSKTRYISKLPSMLACQNFLVDEELGISTYQTEPWLLMNLEVDERKLYLQFLQLDQEDFGDDEIPEFSKVIEWFQGDDIRAETFKDRCSWYLPIRLERILLGREEIYGNCRNLGQVLIRLYHDSQLIHVQNQYLWKLLTLSNDRRNRIIEYFRRYYSNREFGVIANLANDDVRTVSQLREWLYGLFQAGMRQSLVTPRYIEQHIVNSLSDLIQVEVESKKQIPYIAALPSFPEGKKLLTIDVLLFVPNDVREYIANLASADLDTIRCLNTGNEVVFYLSRCTKFEGHRFTEQCIPFWNFKLASDERNKFLTKMRSFYPKAEREFVAVKNVGDLFDWTDRHDFMNSIHRVNEIWRNVQENRNKQEIQEMYRRYDADLEFLATERDKWDSFVAPDRPPVASPTVEETSAKKSDSQNSDGAISEQSQESEAQPVEPEPSTLPEITEELLESSAEAAVSDSPESAEPREESIEEESESSVEDPRPSGSVINNGPHCYMISVFQALACLNEFMEAPECTRTVDECLPCHFRKLAQRSCKLETIHSNEFWETQPHWKNSQLKRLRKDEEDDACSFLLSLIQECGNNIDNMFMMSFSTMLRCTDCENSLRSTMSLENSLTIEVVATDSYEAPSPHYATVSNLVAYYSRVQASRNTCPICSGSEAAEQRTIEDPGKAIIIELMRPLTGPTESAKKIFADEIITVDGYAYSLHAVLVYIPGYTQESEGHYVSYVYINFQWWLMNGVTVRESTAAALNEDSNIVRLIIYKRFKAAEPLISGVSERRSVETIQTERAEYVKLEREISKMATFVEVPEENLNVESWKKFNDLGVVVVANDVKLGPFIRAQISADLLTESDPEASLWKIISLPASSGQPATPSDDQTNKLWKDFNFIFKVALRTYSAVQSENLRNASNRLERWNREKTLEDKLNQYKSFLPVFNWLYTEYRSYHWPQRVVELCTRYSSILTRLQAYQMQYAEELITLIIAEKGIPRAICTALLQNILAIHSIPMTDLIDMLTKFKKEDVVRPLLQKAAKTINQTRNIVLHYNSSHKFTDNHQKDQFFTAFDNFITNFNIQECFPLADSASVTKEYSQTQVSYEFYSEILTAYTNLYTGYQGLFTRFLTAKNATDSCMTQLRTCYDNVEQEKKIVDDLTYS